MFKNDTMEQYVADSLAKQSEPPKVPAPRSGETIIVLFSSAPAA